MFSVPFGYLISQGVLIYLKGENYHFSLRHFILFLFLHILILLPLIINHFKCKKKLKCIFNYYIKKKFEKNEHKILVKALFDYKVFIKGKSYEIYMNDLDFLLWCNSNKELEILDLKTDLQSRSLFFSSFPEYDFKEIINKFEIDDIKENRRKKLKKLNKFW